MRRLAVLLRAVNVGGTGLLPMATLKSFLVGLGYADARTLLASGNAVVTTDEAPDVLAARLEKESRVALDRPLTVLVRDAGDLDAVIAANPFAEAARDRPSQLIVVFGGAPAVADLLDRLASEHDGPERLVVIGRELVIDYPGTLARSTLDRSMRKLRFPTGGTARNWNTMLKLRALL